MENNRRPLAVPVPFPFDHHPFPILPPLIPLPPPIHSPFPPHPFFPHRYYPHQNHVGLTPPVAAAEVSETPADVLEEGVEDGEFEEVLVLTNEWMEFFAKSEAKRKADKKKQKKQRKRTN